MRRFLALIVTTLTLTACQAANAEHDVSGPLIVVLFDVSKSTRDVRGGYLDAFDQVLTYAAEHEGRVVGDLIDANPLAHSTYPIDVTFDGCSALTENPLVCDAESSRLQTQATAAAETMVEGKATTSGTDILGGLRLAERVFASYPEAGERRLVVLSDMVARSDALTLGRGVSDDQVDNVVAGLRTDGQIPDLAGVDVYVVGAGVVSGQELSGDSITAIQRFWERLFDTAGSELRPERYGAALVRFP